MTDTESTTSALLEPRELRILDYLPYTANIVFKELEVKKYNKLQPKRWAQKLMVKWSTDFLSLAAGTAQFAVGIWDEDMLCRRATKYGICRQDLWMAYKRHDHPTPRKQAKQRPFELESFMHAEVNPNLDPLYIVIAEECQTGKVDCPCNTEPAPKPQRGRSKKGKKGKKAPAAKRKKDKKSKKRSFVEMQTDEDSEATDDSDVEVVSNKKKKRRAEESDCDPDSDMFDDDKKKDPSVSISMHNQTMDILNKKWIGKFPGKQLVYWAGKLHDHPQKYNFTEPPEEIMQYAIGTWAKYQRGDRHGHRQGVAIVDAPLHSDAPASERHAPASSAKQELDFAKQRMEFEMVKQRSELDMAKQKMALELEMVKFKQMQMMYMQQQQVRMQQQSNSNMGGMGLSQGMGQGMSGMSGMGMGVEEEVLEEEGALQPLPMPPPPTYAE